MSLHSYLSYDASCAHRRGHSDKNKFDIFLLVTVRPIAHSGQSVFIPNSVGEFGMDTGQLLLASNGM